MPKLISDHQFPNLKQNPETGIYYLRKYLTDRGQLTLSLREKNRSKAIIAMNRALAQWLSSKGNKGEILVDDVIDELLEIYEMKAQATYDNFEVIRRVHIQPYFTGFTLEEMARAIPLYVAHQKKKNPTRKLAHDIKHINRILNHSVERGYIQGFPKYRLEAWEKRPAPGREYSNQEFDLILKYLPKAKYYQAKIMQVTGMRPGEVRTLKKSCINEQHGYIDLTERGLVKDRRERMFTCPKQLIKEIINYSKDNQSEYIFRHEEDPNKPEVKTQKPWQRCAEQILKHHGIKLKVRPNWFRHTFVNRARRAGFGDGEISNNIGNSTALVTRTYAHPSLADKKRMADVVAKSFKAKERRKNA